MFSWVDESHSGRKSCATVLVLLSWWSFFYFIFFLSPPCCDVCCSRVLVITTYYLSTAEWLFLTQFTLLQCLWSENVLTWDFPECQWNTRHMCFKRGNVTESENRLHRVVGAIKSEQRIWAEFSFYRYANLQRPLSEEASSRANTNSVRRAVISQLIFTWQEGRQEARDSSAEHTESIQDSFPLSFVDLRTKNFESLWQRLTSAESGRDSGKDVPVAKEDKEIN